MTCVACPFQSKFLELKVPLSFKQKHQFLSTRSNFEFKGGAQENLEINWMFMDFWQFSKISEMPLHYVMHSDIYHQKLGTFITDVLSWLFLKLETFLNAYNESKKLKWINICVWSEVITLQIKCSISGVFHIRTRLIWCENYHFYKKNKETK